MLEDVSTSITDGPFGSNLKTADYVNDGVRVIRLGNIGTGEFVDDDQSFVSHEKYAGLRKHEAVTGDIVIAALAEPVGRACMVPSSVGLAIVKADCVRARVSSDVAADIVMRWLNSPEGLKSAALASHGIGRLRINLGEVRTLPIPLPPAGEQRRIVAKLDAIFERTRAAKARLERVPSLLEKLKRSILAAAFRGDLTKDWRAAHPDVEPATALLDRIRTERRRRWEKGLHAKGKDPKKATYVEPDPVDASELPELPEGWVWASLDDCCHFVTSGSRGWAEYYSDSGPLFIRVGNLARSGTELRLADVQRVSPPPGAEGERTKVEVGDVLISITADVGRLGVVEADLGDAYINQHVALSRPAAPSLGKFLAVALLNPLGFQKFIVGAQYGMTKASLSLDQVRSAPIAVPPESEITAVLEAISVALGAVDAITMKSKGSSDRLGVVEQAALAKAFRGELVPQDPTDEPASVLLERIRAARAAESGQPRRGRGRRREEDATAKPSNAIATDGHAANGHDDSTDLVVAAFQVDRRLTATAIAETTGLAGSVVKRALKSLVEAGLVCVHGRARSAIYEWTT